MSGLTKMSTATYSTKRNPAASGGKGGVSVTNLTNLSCTPIMPSLSLTNTNPMMVNEPVKGQVKDLYETYIEYQAHTDGGSPVTQLPDVIENDIVVVGSTDYKVRRVENWPATTTLLAFLRVILEESQ
jgi:hypothetical protein